MPDSNRPTPIWGRLSLRLGLLLGVVMFLVLAFQPKLEQWASHWVGIPSPEWLAGLEEAVDTAIFVLDEIQGTQTDRGRQWTISQEAEAKLRPLLAEFARGYLWVDHTGMVRSASDGFEDRVGKTWSDPLESDQEFPIELDGHPQAVAMPVPMADEEENLAGTLVAVDYSSQPGFDGVGRLFLEEFEIDLYIFPLHDHLINHRMDQINLRMRRWVTLVFSAAISLLLGWILSVWVTRRLSRLIEEADHPVQSGLDLPGPFPAHGADEVARLGRALNRMRDRTAGLLLELQNQDEARRRWITQVSHDIRTPLAALSACLDRAHRLAANGQLQQHGVELLTAATHDANRVQSLAEDLLEVARLQAGEPLNKEILMPEELLGNIARGFGPLVEAGGLKLQLDVASPLPDVYADGRLLLRALENLLRNAQRHAQSQIQLRAFATDSKQLQIEVWDDGSGFNVDVGRLEDRRLEELRKTADSTGLGLQLTRQVIEAHDGTVELAQSASGGAGVIVCLPLANGQSNST